MLTKYSRRAVRGQRLSGQRGDAVGDQQLPRIGVRIHSQQRIGRDHLSRHGEAPFRKNQFGGTLGGPIKKDKMFFFENYEGIRQVTGQTNLRVIPDANALQG